jgi:hypothetical protein
MELSIFHGGILLDEINNKFFLRNTFIGSLLKDLEKVNESTDITVTVSEISKFYYHMQIRQYISVTYQCLYHRPALCNNNKKLATN